MSRLCPQLVELRGVSVGVLDERYRGEKHLQVRRCCGTGTVTFCRSGTGTVILLTFFSFTFYKNLMKLVSVFLVKWLTIKARFLPKIFGKLLLWSKYGTGTVVGTGM